MMGKASGFTLIELLIVVAIIAILAAIAVPNFLEAQTRAKVSRARADMRTVATAFEVYAVDHNHYPPNPDPRAGFNVIPPQLTTPLAYLSSRPKDPFKAGKQLARTVNLPQFESEAVYYDCYTIISTQEWLSRSKRGVQTFILNVDASGGLANVANRGAFEKYGKWMIWSVGPDAKYFNLLEDFTSPAGQFLRAPMHLPWGYSFDISYDPTNGTMSFGNIIRTALNPEGTRPLSL